MNPETVSLNRERQALDHAQRLLDAGHPVKATKAMRRLALRSPAARDSDHAQLCPTTVKRLTPKRRPGKSPQQIRDHYYWLVYKGKSNQAAAYFDKHTEDIMRGLLSTPVEVYEHTSPRPTYKPDRDDFIASYHYEMRKWKHEMQRRYTIKQYAKQLEDDGSYLAKTMLKTHIKKNQSVFDTPDPEEPVQPPALHDHTPPPISCDKTNALTAIDKRMAAERQKISKDDKPRPVMRHHVDANPWLYAKHARNK